MCPGLRRSTLFSAITTGHAEAEHALGDVAVAGPDPLARREHEQHGVDVLERLVDRALHPLGQRVARPLEARQVGEHELVVVARSRSPSRAGASSAACRRRSPPCPRRARSRASTSRRWAARRRRRSRSSRAAHPRPGWGSMPAALGGERYSASAHVSVDAFVTSVELLAGAEGRAGVSPAPTCPAAARRACTLTSSPSRLRNVTRSSRNSYSHWRQPPQGEAVIADRLEVAGPAARDDGARDRRPSPRRRRADRRRSRRSRPRRRGRRAPAPRRRRSSSSTARTPAAAIATARSYSSSLTRAPGRRPA